LETNGDDRCTLANAGGNDVWVTADGVLHTVSLPDPAVIMSPEFEASVKAIGASRSKALARALEQEADVIYSEAIAAAGEADDEPGFVRAIPPRGLLADPVGSVEDIHRVIRSTDRRWRLDAIMAIGDLCERRSGRRRWWPRKSHHPSP
jgi:hypothetical protein